MYSHMGCIGVYIHIHIYIYIYIYIYICISYSQHSSVVHAVAQFFEALRYKSEGRGFNTPLCQWDCSLT